MTLESQTTDIQQDIIVQSNEEIDGLHDALGILHAEIEQLQVTIAELKAENTKLTRQILGKCSPSTEFNYMEDYARLD